MKRVLLIIMVFCTGFLAGCNKDNNGVPPEGSEAISLMDGSIIIDHHPDVRITSLSDFPLGKSTSTTSFSSAGRKRTGIHKKAADGQGNELRGNNYRFKRVAEMSTLTISGGEVQATHVKISDDGYAFVTYNDQGDAHRGGVVVYKYTIHDGTLDDVTVDVKAISSMTMAHAELSAIDYNNGKLYMTGASSEPKFGYDEDVDGYDYAFFMVMELNADKTFKEVAPVIKKLTSFQGTSIRFANNRIYITTGDGANDTNGGLYIYSATDYSRVKFIENKDNVRSADVDANNVYLMQAEPARVTKYNLDGNGEDAIYVTDDESLQHHAKSEILVWDNYVFVAENESGLRMLNKETGAVNESLDRPGESAEKHVTNSVHLNSDPKKDGSGKFVESNLLFLANGEKGIYWYDVMKDGNGGDRIVPCNSNSILDEDGLSANFITSKGNIVFVADGLGGLKVLYIGFNKVDEPPVGDGCDKFMLYTFNGEDTPEGKSVFRPEAPYWITTLFSDVAVVPNYIEVKNSTELYITYLFEGAGWHNSLGYFVIPATVPKNDADEIQYYKTVIEPVLCKKISTDVVLNNDYIIFRDIADKSRGGSLQAPNMYRIGNGTFNAGDRVVLFVVPNGWSSQNDRVEYYYEDEMFFTHTGLNLDKDTGVGEFPPQFGDFTGQYNTFFSADCKSIVVFFEDNHNADSDTDYNDMIFSITDNLTGDDIINLVLPKWAIGLSEPEEEFEFFETITRYPN